MLNIYGRFVKVAVLDRCLTCFEVCQSGSPDRHTASMAWHVQVCEAQYVILFNQKAAW